jgi:hypothetical protein
LQANFVQAKQDIEKLSQEKQELQANFVQAKQSMASLQDQLTAAHIENERLSKEDYYTRKWLRQTYAERNELRRWAGIRAAVNEWSKRLVSVVGKRVPNRLTKPRRQPVRVCVDLTTLLAKGKNSELALAIMNLLKRLSQDERFEFIYVGLEDSSAEVDALLRRQDALILISLDPRKARHRPSQVEIIQTLKVANLRRHQTDIFYAPFGEVSAVARSFKTVCFVPDLPHHDFSGLVSPDQLDSCELSMANTLSTASKVQLGSEYMRQRLIEAYPIWPGNTLVTYLRMDCSIITERSAQSRARPFFICPKGYYSRKSSEALLAGYKSYLTFAGETWWGLVLAGYEDDRRHDLRELVHSLELDDHVEFEDYLRGETFTSLLQTASALVYPTLHEGSGIPIFEAFRSSVPVVCSSLCSLPEVAGDAALYVNPYTPGEITHALLAVASSEETRSRLISLGRQQLNKFSPEDETKKLADAFLDLAEAR